MLQPSPLLIVDISKEKGKVKGGKTSPWETRSSEMRDPSV